MKTIKNSRSLSILWLSDLHLDKVNVSQINKLLDSIQNSSADIIAITGDTSNSRHLKGHLTTIAQASAPRPVYVVCGNHDYYGSSIKKVNADLGRLCDKVANLYILNGRKIIPLQQNTCLIGVGGWADARAGYGLKTYLRSPDHYAIQEFQKLTRQQSMLRMREMGGESAELIRQILPFALSRYHHVILLTHAPPFAVCARYNGVPCGPLHSPHYTNVSAGLAISGISRAFPRRQITILAGHTHCANTTQIKPNIVTHVAHARTGRISQPKILTF